MVRQTGPEKSEEVKKMNGNGRPWWFLAMQTFGVPTGLLIGFAFCVWQAVNTWMLPQVEANAKAVLSTIKTNEQIVETLGTINDSVSELGQKTQLSADVTRALLDGHRQIQEDHDKMLQDLEALKKKVPGE